jgi:2-haloacid dehalogenase
MKALCFDVIGTVVDWRGTILREIKRLGKEKGVEGDWNVFAWRWAAYYSQSESFNTEADLRLGGRVLLQEYCLSDKMTQAEVDAFSRLWTQLRPWPDADRGLNRLRKKYKVATLSNCSRALLIALSRNVGLVWDVVLSAEVVKVKKPNPAVYRMAARSLGLPPEQIMMVAAHLYDVRAAQKLGFHTAFVQRGDDGPPTKNDKFSVVVDNFEQLAKHVNA